MARDPRCAAVVAALAAGDPVDPAHLAACPSCRGHAALAAALRAAPVDAPPTDPAALRPDPAALGAAVRARGVRAAALSVVTVSVLAGSLGLLLPASPGSLRAPEGPPSVAAAPLVAAPGADPTAPDLLAALDDADRALDPAALPEDDLLVLLEPPDPLADPDPLEAALLGDWSL